MKSVWEKYLETADKYNEPGVFTAMIGYEWTSVPGGNNLHRNILFRGDASKAKQVFPFSARQSEDPEKLWAWMDAYEKKTGDQVLAIPHNGNLSNGRMFELIDFQGSPLSKDYAQRRTRWERLQGSCRPRAIAKRIPRCRPTTSSPTSASPAGNTAT